MPTHDLLREHAADLEAIGAEPFLVAMAEDRLPDDALGRWVREDTFFLRALRRMIGRLIAEAPTEKAIDVMAGAFPALQSELDTFALEAARLGQDLGAEPADVTCRFDALLGESAQAGFADGIATYWAVEMAYLQAWSAVRRRVGVQGPYAGWIENWTSDAFREFVAQLAVLADEHADTQALSARTTQVLALEQELWRWCHAGT